MTHFKMEHKSKQKIRKGGNSNGQGTHTHTHKRRRRKELFNIHSHQENMNQNNFEFSSYTSHNDQDQYNRQPLLTRMQIKENESIASGSAKFLRNLGIDLTQAPALPLLGLYPKDSSSHHRDSGSTIFIAALFIKDRNQKQPKIQINHCNC